jgi:mannose-6-phosphate isomerase-like protein (cupin superfamily)
LVEAVLILRYTELMNKIYIAKPWGSEDQFTLNEKTTVKILKVKAGAKLSLQFHSKRSEFWKVLAGKVSAILDDKTLILEKDAELEIPVGAKHRVEAKDGDAEILEISFGDFDEEDIVRLEDSYGRV